MLFGAFLLALATLQTAAKPASVALPHDWSVGTRYHIELVKSREDVEGDQPPSVSSTRMPIDVIHYPSPEAAEATVIYAVGDIHGRLDLLLAMESLIARDIAETLPRRPDPRPVIQAGKSRHQRR